MAGRPCSAAYWITRLRLSVLKMSVIIRIGSGGSLVIAKNAASRSSGARTPSGTSTCLSGRQFVNEAGKTVESTLRLKRMLFRVRRHRRELGKIAHHPGTQNPRFRVLNSDQSDAVDVGRFGEPTGLQQFNSDGDNDPLDETEGTASALVMATPTLFIHRSDGNASE